jgi:hypothetical protein
MLTTLVFLDKLDFVLVHLAFFVEMQRRESGAEASRGTLYEKVRVKSSTNRACVW